jgi:hypothetical protein
MDSDSQASPPASAHPSALFAPVGAAFAEAGRLDTTLARLAELHEALLAGRPDPAPAPLLSELRSDLALHFAREEADKNFGALLRDSPGLSHAIAELKHDHLALLEQLDVLKAAASAEPRDLSARLVHFLEAFRAHEHKEADLLQESVLRDDGTVD